MPVYKQFRTRRLKIPKERRILLAAGEEHTLPVVHELNGELTLRVYPGGREITVRGNGVPPTIFPDIKINTLGLKTVKTSDEPGGRDIIWRRR